MTNGDQNMRACVKVVDHMAMDCIYCAIALVIVIALNRSYNCIIIGFALCISTELVFIVSKNLNDFALIVSKNGWDRLASLARALEA